MLKKIRENLKLTQQQVAEKSNLSVKTIYNIERKNTANLKTIKKIAKALKVKIEDILK